MELPLRFPPADSLRQGRGGVSAADRMSNLSHPPTPVGLVDALSKGPPPRGNLAVPIFAHGSLAVELYTPKGRDPQEPHDRDEVYLVARGSGTFFDGSRRHAVEAGAFLFVPAGQQHRFEDFSADFAVWVLFYGPIGGEARAGREFQATTIREIPLQPSLAKRLRVRPQDIGLSFRRAFAEISEVITVVGARSAGPAYVRYLKHDEQAGFFEIEVGIPVAAAAAGRGDVLGSELPGGRAVSLWHLGRYESLGESHETLHRSVATRGLNPVGGPWETYHVGAVGEPDSGKWRTELVQPVGPR